MIIIFININYLDYFFMVRVTVSQDFRFIILIITLKIRVIFLSNLFGNCKLWYPLILYIVLHNKNWQMLLFLLELNKQLF